MYCTITNTDYSDILDSDMLEWVLHVVHTLAASGVLGFEKEIKINSRELRNALNQIEQEIERIAAGLPQRLKDAAFSYRGVQIVCDKLMIKSRMETTTRIEVRAHADVDYKISFATCEVTPRIQPPCVRVKPIYTLEEPPSPGEATCSTFFENNGRWISVKHISGSVVSYTVFCKGELYITTNLGFSLKFARNVGDKCTVRLIIGIAPEEEYYITPLNITFIANIDFEKMTAKISSHAEIVIYDTDLPIKIDDTLSKIPVTFARVPA